MKTHLKALLTITLVSFFSLSIFAQQEQWKVSTIKDNLYAITGIPGGNIAFLVTDEGILVIDSGSIPADGSKIVEKIAKTSSKPITHLIYTHFHNDHINGSAGFPENIQIIAHETVKQNLIEITTPDLKKNIEKTFPEYIKGLEEKLEKLKAENDPNAEKMEQQLKANQDYFNEYKKIKIRLPEITFTDNYTLKLGKEEIELIYQGQAHTSGNCVVIFPRHKAIHTGDLVFNNMYPYVIPEHGANTANWLDKLNELYKMNLDYVIPGHGDLTNKEGIAKQISYFKSLRTEVKAGIDKGTSLEEMQKTIKLSEFENMKGNQFTKNIQTIYLELNK